MTAATGNLQVIVLAAGASTRLGQPKQLVRLGGRPVLHRVVGEAVAVGGSSVTVVLGAHARELSRLLQNSPASVIVNRHWEEGMAASIRCGLAAAPASAEAVLILLGDQVAVSAEDLRRLIAAWGGHDTIIAASVYGGTLGVPAIFPRFCWRELAELRGDCGARAVIQRHAARLVHVPMPSASVDLDTPQDLARILVREHPPAGTLDA
jgi:molybdenum cofactor cytidylyltransferase